MSSRVVTVLLAVVLLFLVVALLPVLGQVRGSGVSVGFSPEQPIAFSHRLHAGELEIACLYCHGDAERSRHAGIPAASICMNCHRFVTAPITDVKDEERRAAEEGRPPELVVSPELRKLYDAQGLDEKLEPDPEKTPHPIRWVRIHRLPDFVWFDHRPHVAAGVACEKCHGAVQLMERVRQDQTLSMGFCLDCHRTWTGPDSRQPGQAPGAEAVRPSTDCSTCHF